MNGQIQTELGDSHARAPMPQALTLIERSGWVLASLLFMLCLCRGVAEAQYTDGSGTPDDPYLVTNAEQMDTIGQDPNHWDKHFKLVADLDLSDYQERRFHAIGNDDVPFSGVFDGNDHTISHFSYYARSDIEEMLVSEADLPEIPGLPPRDPNGTVTRIRAIPAGLFGTVSGPSAMIKNLSLREPNVCTDPQQRTGASEVGALIGFLYGGASVSHCSVQDGQISGWGSIGGLIGVGTNCTITHCSVSCHVSNRGRRNSMFFGGLIGALYGGAISHCSFEGSVEASIRVGGLVGWCERDTVLSHCSVSGTVVGEQWFVGGLVGEAEECEISHCHTDTEVSFVDGPRRQEACGGLVGLNKGVITDCSASGSVSLPGDATGGGGLVGKNSGSLLRCSATATVSGNRNIGGLVGVNAGDLLLCSAAGPVSGDNTVGGLIGLQWDGQAADCYAQGEVSGPNEIGGLIGALERGPISRCYARGKASGQQATGGLVGFLRDGGFPLQVEQCFWAMEASGQQQSAVGTGLGAGQAVDRATYTAAGWDFVGESTNGREDLWYIPPGSEMYPALTWQCEPQLKMLFDLDSDPGWAREGPWDFGSPQGLGAWQNGYPDPPGAYTGDNVFGVNLQGDYALTDLDPYTLTSGPLDFSEYSHVHVAFARWLNSDEADFVRTFIEVSPDGTTWQPVWEHSDRQAGITDDAWQIVRYPLGAIVNQQPRVFIRWGYHVLDAEAWPFSGWNIDDVQILALE